MEKARSWSGIGDDEIGEARRNIFEDSRPGYHLFRGFLDPATAATIATVWARPDTLARTPRYYGRYALYEGCPNYVDRSLKGTVSAFNFFWNPPIDEATYSIAYQIQTMRNRVEGQPVYREFSPWSNHRAASFRVVRDRHGANLVPSHRDFLAKEDVDTQRTQVTLFLSEKGRDYEGTGFMFSTNQGRRISLGTDVVVAPGDLMIWRYNNEHQVDEVRSSDSDFGFMRLIFPPERFRPRLPFAVAGLPIIAPAVMAGFDARYRYPHIAKRWVSDLLRRT
jgi:hypothetical protein